MKTLLFFLGFAGLGAWLLPAAGRMVGRHVQKTEEAAAGTAHRLEQRAGDELKSVSENLIQTLTTTIENAAASLPPVALPGGGASWVPAPAVVPEITPLRPLALPWPAPFCPGPFWPRPIGPRDFERMPRRFPRNR